MQKIGLFLLFLGAAFGLRAQIITSSTAVEVATTNYTNNAPNDSIFFICSGQTGSLSATPTSGVGPYDFVWQIFVPATNSWGPFSMSNDVLTSTINNLQPGGYRLQITDSNGLVTDTDVAWICRINSNPSVNVFDIPAGCGNVQLLGQVTYGSITPYYNPPAAADPSNSIIIDANTQIQVCFNATHTWVSDLAFYLIGPPSCGSPVILLSPNPGAIGQGAVCNSGDNVNNLCFSTESTNILNVCSGGAFSLTGTFGGYGPGAGTLINWNTLFGCDATSPGWTVQIFDCIGGDVGALTSASITFTGTTIGGTASTVTYNSGTINSVINDNSCSAATASIYSVGSPAAVPINFTTGYVWTSDPPVIIPNSTSSLNITLNPGPQQNVNFTLTITGTHPGAVCSGNDTDTEEFVYLPPSTASVDGLPDTICTDGQPITLNGTPSGGSWTGPGVTAGVFNPATAGPGTHTITYSFGSACVTAGTDQITVQAVVDPTIIDPGDICVTGGTVDLSSVQNGGVWSGTGIVNAATGLFDPTITGIGQHTIFYDFANSCNGHGEIVLNVTPEPQVTINDPGGQCIGSPNVILTASIPDGFWSGQGIINPITGEFSPAVAGVGTWTITYTVVTSCPSMTTIQIEVEDDNVVNAVTPPTQCNNGVPITLSADIPGGVWSGPGITNGILGVFNPANANIGANTITYLIDGTCDASDQITINVTAAPDIVFTDPGTLCSNDSPVVLAASPAGGTWSGAGITNVNTGAFDPAVAGGPVNVSYSVEGNQCTSTETLSVSIFTAPNVNASNNTAVCAGECANISATGALNYIWSPSNTLNSSTGAQVQACPTTTTTYTVTGTTAEGCSSTDQVTVTVNPLPQVNAFAAQSQICENSSTVLGATGLVTYQWSGGPLNNSTSPTPTASPGTTTTYTVTGTDANGCTGTDQVTVTVIQINPSFFADPAEGFEPLTVTFINNSVGDSFSWDFGNGDSEQANNNAPVTTTYSQDGFYDATLTVFLDGCSESATVQIIAFNVAELLVPNVVTDNRDGKNDVFTVQSDWLETLDIQIFNRWGQKVGTIDRPDQVWNPTDYPAGTYFFILKAKGFDGTEFEQEGNFTLLKD